MSETRTVVKIEDALRMFGLAILASGGTITIPNNEKIDDIELSAFDDVANGQTIYRAKRITLPPA